MHNLQAGNNKFGTDVFLIFICTSCCKQQSSCGFGCTHVSSQTGNKYDWTDWPEWDTKMLDSVVLAFENSYTLKQTGEVLTCAIIHHPDIGRQQCKLRSVSYCPQKGRSVDCVPRFFVPSILTVYLEKTKLKSLHFCKSIVCSILEMQHIHV